MMSADVDERHSGAVSMNAKEDFPSTTFLARAKSLPPATRAIIDQTFSLALEIMIFKYQRKKESHQKKSRSRGRTASRSLNLKEKDVSNALAIADFHIGSKARFDVDSRADLRENFGSFPLQDALRYYDSFLLDKPIDDMLRRKVHFTENGKKFLYKEHSAEGHHVVAEENYVEARGRRLRWIPPLLRTTTEIYRECESFWETFLYVGTFLIALAPHVLGDGDKIVANYFMVVARRKRGKPIEFVTAYFMDTRSDLMKHLEKASPVYLLFNDQDKCK